MVPYSPIWSRWYSLVPYGTISCSMVPYGMVPYGPVCSCMVPYGSVWFRMVPNGPVWPCKGLYCLVWSRMVLYSPVWSVWSRIVLYGAVWSCMVLYGLVLSPTYLYGPVWSCFVFYGLTWESRQLQELAWDNIKLENNTKKFDSPIYHNIAKYDTRYLLLESILYHRIARDSSFCNKLYQCAPIVRLVIFLKKYSSRIPYLPTVWSYAQSFVAFF